MKIGDSTYTVKKDSVEVFTVHKSGTATCGNYSLKDFKTRFKEVAKKLKL